MIRHFDEEGTFTVTMMARILRVSRAGYYGWKKCRNQNYPLSTPRGFRDQIADNVKEIFAKHNGFAGVRTIATELGTRGITVTLYAVRKTMRKLELVTKYRRGLRRTTIADANAETAAILYGAISLRQFQQRTCAVILPTFVPGRVDVFSDSD